MDQKIRFGVLWKNTTREGNRPYLSGRVDLGSLDAAVDLLRTGGRFLVLSNKKRPDKRDPDCILWVVPETPLPATVDPERAGAAAERRPGAVPANAPPRGRGGSANR